MTAIEDELREKLDRAEKKLKVANQALKLYEQTTGMLYSPKLDCLVDKGLIHYEP